jgi:two-component system, cell cycle sensor histidine kinase and response regulator CckA
VISRSPFHASPTPLRAHIAPRRTVSRVQAAVGAVLGALVFSASVAFGQPASPAPDVPAPSITDSAGKAAETATASVDTGLRWSDIEPYWVPVIVGMIALLLAFLVQLRLLRRLRRQTAALKLSEERLTLVLDGSEDAFWDWDVTNGRVDYSDRWAEILGCRPDELVPQIDAFRPLTHPDDFDRAEQGKRHILRDGHGRVEYRLRASDGGWRWIYDRGKVVARDADGRPTRVTGAASDITIRKRIEEVLIRSQTLLEQTQQAAEMGGWEYDLRNRSLFWTKETYRIHDLAPDEQPITEERALNFCTPQSQTILSSAYERAIREKLPFDVELELVTAKSRLIWVRCIGRVEHAGDRAVRLYGSIQDITSRKKAEEERQKLQLKMLEAQKLESLGVLAGGIAHDFNNILTVIMGNASLAREAPELTKDAIDHIETASNRAADLCRQMLAYAGRSRFALETLDLNTVVEDTVHLLKLSISKSAALDFALAKEPLGVEADASQVRQVIMNLVINASDAIGTAAGRIRVSTSHQKVTREDLREARLGQDAPEGDYVCLEVEDNGCGMSSETLGRIFDPFFTTKFTGRGLGLAAVLGIVRAHKGAFFVRSALGQGSVFRMLLPRTKSPLPEPVVDTTRTPFNKPAEGAILVVDDEPHVRKVAGAILEKQGYSVAVAADGYEALALALAHGMRFTAVLLDLTMPGLDGPATLREIRALNKTVPVLIMSGYSEADAKKHFLNDPHVGFLPKPFAADDLLKRLYKLLNRPLPELPGS